MRALQTQHDHPFLPTGAWSEKSARHQGRPRREGHGVPVLANPKANDRLDSWKEIASHLKRTVRTVQRWERHEGMPVHRHLHQRANSVYARRSELDDWWNREPRCLKIERLGVLSERSRHKVPSPLAFKAIHSEMGGRDASSTTPKWQVECIQESPEAVIGSAEDGTGSVVCVLRGRIRLEE